MAVANSVFGQSFGVELHNTLMPASGGMGGVSIALPQDLTSAMNANPATLAQFRGTQVIFGGAWAEPTFNLTQTSDIPILSPMPLIEPFSAKSHAPGTPAGNIGVTQDLSALGLPATLGIGFLTTAGGFVDFRELPESHGADTGQTIFSMPVAVGVELSDRLSAGAGVSLGIASFDGPFVGVDVIYKLWDEANLYKAIYDDQWAVQVGAQLTRGRYRLRAGYVWAENPVDDTPGANVGGVVQPGDFPAVRYTQGLMAITHASSPCNVAGIHFPTEFTQCSQSQVDNLTRSPGYRAASRDFEMRPEVCSNGY